MHHIVGCLSSEAQVMSLESFPDSSAAVAAADRSQ